MPKLIHLQSHSDPRGVLTVIEKELPTPIRRVYYIYGVPPNTSRGGHAHNVTTQTLICVSGSCSVVCGHPSEKKEAFILDSPEKALILNPEDYHIMENFSPDTILLVLSSHPYDRNDYILGE